MTLLAQILVRRLPKLGKSYKWSARSALRKSEFQLVLPTSTPRFEKLFPTGKMANISGSWPSGILTRNRWIYQAKVSRPKSSERYFNTRMVLTGVFYIQLSFHLTSRATLQRIDPSTQFHPLLYMSVYATLLSPALILGGYLELRLLLRHPNTNPAFNFLAAMFYLNPDTISSSPPSWTQTSHTSMSIFPDLFNSEYVRTPRAIATRVLSRRRLHRAPPLCVKIYLNRSVCMTHQPAL